MKQTEEFKNYRKKPVVIQAAKITEQMQIETLEGVMTGEVGDWLIIGVAGERYPCKDHIFQQTYEEVEPPPRKNILTYFKDAELNLKREQESNPNRSAAIALTHLQTAILWLESIDKSNE